MLNEKQKEVLAFLRKNEKRWITSKELASFCGCTTRTIRNRVAQINEEAPHILTSYQGYRLNPAVSTQLNQDETGDRKSRIFLELLKNSSEGVNLYELSDSLFISESTLKTDIQQLKKEVIDNNIQIVYAHDFVKLTGSERSKRRYMISLLYNEGDLQEKLKASIQQMIGYISMEKLQTTIREVMVSRGIQMNQYSLNNIVLHYAISIERIRQGHVMKKSPEYPSLEGQTEYLIAKEIADTLSEDYQINFSTAELEQLALLFIGMQNETSANRHDQQLAAFVDPKIIDTLHAVLKQVEQTYLIELNDEAFFNKLAIHVQSLYYRSHYENFTRNSSLLDLKTAYPLTYDLSVYISSLIQERLGIWFNDDEISFIALHIGAFLENQKHNYEAIRMVLVVNEYHDMSHQLQQKLENRFGDRVTIFLVNKAALASQSYEMLVTTDRVTASEYSGAVFIHPFLTDKDLRKIENRLYSLYAQKHKKQMYHYIEQFISKELYFNQIDPSELTPKEIRAQINQKLVMQGFVKETFSQSVEKREAMSPTSFPSGIAVPHSIELEAVRSGIAMMTLQEAIIWSGYPVKLIALIAINKNEAKAFNEFFEQFIEIVSDPVNTKQLSMAEDYETFIMRLKMMVDANN
ncbi:BglG family transcription antiterminator [Isobaculum melis]|uniref:Transcriptional antiterminator, BglG family n=1 Tax=Isobaculum melis TaxID=142588 RepID=A0A1H9Q5H1_9LACT|nr:BglG family transcription antiterminator [Isobaculum melis]SER55681.1 transcriptional antiterminator, BglG family [Isobaculum melis]